MFVHRRKYTSRVIILFVKASRSIIHRPSFYVIFYESKNRQMNARNKYVFCRLCAQNNLWSANLRYRTSIESQQLDIGSSLRRTSDLNQNPKLPSHPLLFGLTLPFPLSLSLSLFLSLYLWFPFHLWSGVNEAISSPNSLQQCLSNPSCLLCRWVHDCCCYRFWNVSIASNGRFRLHDNSFSNLHCSLIKRIVIDGGGSGANRQRKNADISRI